MALSTISGVGAGSSGTILTTTNPKSGNVLQVVSSVSNAEYNIAASGTGGAFTAWTQLTSYNITITPSFSTSKIYLFATIPWFGIANGGATGDVQALWYRNATQLNGGQSMATTYIANNTYVIAPVQFMDSPATTSAITYYLYGRGRYLSAGEYSFNRGGNGSVILTAMEIAG